MHSEKGFSLAELLVLIAVIGILSAIAVPFGREFIERHRISSASRELYATLQELRLNAMTKAPANPSVPELGTGIRFVGSTGYVTFRFNDANNNFTYDNTGEETDAVSRTFSGISMTDKDGASLSDTVLLYDKQGLARVSNWSSIAGGTYVLKGSKAEGRCVTVSSVRIREGIWNGSECTEF